MPYTMEPLQALPSRPSRLSTTPDRKRKRGGLSPPLAEITIGSGAEESNVKDAVKAEDKGKSETDSGQDDENDSNDSNTDTSSSYNPDAIRAVEAARRRLPPYASPTPPARCRRCHRVVSPLFNRLVRCRTCDVAWHQLCHDPALADAALNGWSCGCQDDGGDSGDGDAPLDQDHALRRTIALSPHVLPLPDSRRVSWAGRPAAEKHAYLASLSGHALVQLLLQSVALHPDLPLFPPGRVDPVDQPGRMGRADHPPILSVRRKPGPKSKGRGPKTGRPRARAGPVPSVARTPTIMVTPLAVGTLIDPDEEDPTGLMEAWPMPGLGLYAALGPDGDEMGGPGGFAHDRFSHMVYGEGVA